MAHLIEARAHHLRLAAQAVRVLHACAIDDATRGSRCRPAARDRRARPRSAPDGRAPRECAHRTACRWPRHASTACAPATSAAAIARSVANKRRARAPSTPACRSEVPGLPSGRARAAPCRHAASAVGAFHDRRHRTRASPSPISTADRCASGARSPEAPTEPCAGMHGITPAFSSCEQRFDHLAANARMAARRAPRP